MPKHYLAGKRAGATDGPAEPAALVKRWRPRGASTQVHLSAALIRPGLLELTRAAAAAKARAAAEGGSQLGVEEAARAFFGLPSSGDPAAAAAAGAAAAAAAAAESSVDPGRDVVLNTQL